MATEDSTPEPAPEAELAPIPTPPAGQPSEIREMTVSYQRAAMLRLQGHWLERAGLPIGTKVRVHVYNRRLEIEAIDEPAPVQLKPRKSKRLLPDAAVDWQPPRLEEFSRAV